MRASWCDLFPRPKCVQLPYLRHLFKDIWIAATDYYMHFYIIMLLPLTAILQLINFTASYFFSLLINVVILLLNCLGLILYYLPPAEGRGREIIKRLPSVRPFVTFLHKP